MSFAIRFENVSFAYPKKKTFALENVSFEVKEGSFFALLGANGAGKTTLLRLLSKRLPLENGKILYSESLLKNKALNLASLGILLENPGSYLQLSTEEYLKLFASLYGNENDYKNGLALLEQLGFSEKKDSRLGKLSLGNKQKLQIARAMQHSPRCLLLDEPAANLDPVSREILWEMLAKWQKENNGTLIVCSHILPELEKYATDYAILKKGVLEKSGNLKLKEDSKKVLFEISNSEKKEVEKLLLSAGVEFKEQPFKQNTLENAYRNVYAKER